MVNGCLIEYKWFQPHFTANLFHLPLIEWHTRRGKAWQGRQQQRKKVILHHHHHHDTDNYWEQALEAIDMEHPLSSEHRCLMYQHTITKWFICKYRPVNGNWFAWDSKECFYYSKAAILLPMPTAKHGIRHEIYMTNVRVINCIVYLSGSHNKIKAKILKRLHKPE